MATTSTQQPIQDLSVRADMALAEQEIRALVAEAELSLSRINDPATRDEVARNIGGIRMQLAAGLTPVSAMALKLAVEQVRVDAAKKAELDTARSSEALMSGIMLSAAAEERIRIRSQEITHENILQFTETFLQDTDLDPDTKASVARSAARILDNSPTIAELNALPKEVREEAYRSAEEGKAKVETMLQDPKYAGYARTLRAFQRFDLASSPEGLELLGRIERGEITAEDARTAGRTLVEAKGGRADRHDREIASGLRPGALDELQAAGLARGNDLDMQAIFKARDELPDGWGERSRAYRGKPLAEWPAELRREAAIREAAQTGVLVTSVEDILRIGKQLERGQQRDLSPEAQAKLEQAQQLYLTMTDPSADKATRYAAVDAYLSESNSSYAGASDWVKKNTVERILAGIDADPEMYRGSSTREQFSAHVTQIVNYEGDALKQYDVTLSSEQKNAVAASTKDMVHMFSEWHAERVLHTEANAELAATAGAGAAATQVTAQTATTPTPAELIASTATPVPVPADPVAALGMTNPTDKRAEGSHGTWDNLYENALEKTIKSVLSGASAEAVAAAGKLLGQYNVGDQNYYSVHEFENALAAAGVTRASDITSLDDIVAKLTPAQLADKGPQTGRA